MAHSGHAAVGAIVAIVLHARLVTPSCQPRRAATAQSIAALAQLADGPGWPRSEGVDAACCGPLYCGRRPGMMRLRGGGPKKEKAPKSGKQAQAKVGLWRLAHACAWKPRASAAPRYCVPGGPLVRCVLADAVGRPSGWRRTKCMRVWRDSVCSCEDDDGTLMTASAGEEVRRGQDLRSQEQKQEQKSAGALIIIIIIMSINAFIILWAA
jgi:hypothetical protein